MEDKKKEETKGKKEPQGAPMPPPPMDGNRAINILIESAKVAQSRGAFNLEEAAIVSQAVTFFKVASAKKQPNPPKEPVDQDGAIPAGANQVPDEGPDDEKDEDTKETPAN